MKTKVSSYYGEKSKEELLKIIFNDTFLETYIEALFFTEASSHYPEEGSFSNEFGLSDFTQESLARIVSDCRLFETLLSEKLDNEGIEFETTQEVYNEFGNEEGHAGRDFWYTRNGHGCGFWDDDWNSPFAEIATTLSTEFGEQNIYEGDDGFLYAYPE